MMEMKRTNPKAPSNVEGCPTLPPIGLCFPCHFCGRARGSRKDLVQERNPFALLPDLRGAYTFAPIRVYWFPAQGSYIKKLRYKKLNITHMRMCGDASNDWLLYCSHESVHILLIDTVLGYWTLFLVQCQLLAIVQAIQMRYQIYIPSLNEPSGYIAAAQKALDTIDGPMALIHELMAVTLPLFCAEHGFLPMTSQFSRRIVTTDEGLDPRLRQPHKEGKTLPLDYDYECLIAEETEEKFFAKFTASFISRASLAQRVKKVTNNKKNGWMAQYSKTFDTWLEEYSRAFCGYDKCQKPLTFRGLHRMLLDAWGKIVNSVDSTEEWLPLVLALARYPVEVEGPPLSTFEWPSSKAFFDWLVSYVTGMAHQPVTRLDTMLEVIGKADGLQGFAAWKDYLLEQLPELEVSEPLPETGVLEKAFRTYLPYLSMDVKQLWEDNGSPEAGKIFEKVYAYPNETEAMFTRLPIFQGFYRPDSSLGFLVVLEVMRQALMALRRMAAGGQGISFNGLRCLCGPDVQSRCIEVRKLLKDFWELVTADEGYEEWFKQHWQKLECI